MPFLTLNRIISFLTALQIKLWTHLGVILRFCLRHYTSVAYLQMPEGKGSQRVACPGELSTSAEADTNIRSQTLPRLSLWAQPGLRQALRTEGPE